MPQMFVYQSMLTNANLLEICKQIMLGFDSYSNLTDSYLDNIKK